MSKAVRINIKASHEIDVWFKLTTESTSKSVNWNKYSFILRFLVRKGVGYGCIDDIEIQPHQ